MKIQRFTPWLAPMLALGACGGGPNEPSGANSSGGEVAVVDPIAARLPPTQASLESTSAPTELVHLVRFGHVGESFPLAMRLLGIPGDPAEKTTRGIEANVGSSALAGVVDRRGGMDAAFVVVEGDFEDVYAFDGPSAREVLVALPRGVETEALADGSLRVHDDAAVESSVRECSVEPTGDAARTRIVCAHDADALQLVRRYLGHGLTGEVAVGTLQASVAVDSLRARYGEEARAALALGSTVAETALERLSTNDTSDPMTMAFARLLRSEAVRTALLALARDVLDDAASLVSEVGAIELVARIDGDELRIDGELVVSQASGSIVRGVAAALRPVTPVPELIDRLPPGAVAYFTGRSDSRPFEDLLGELRAVIAALAQSGIQLSQADRDALDRALALMYRPHVYDFGGASGSDAQVRTWTVMHARFASPEEARAAVDAMRQAVQVFRRPAVARALDEIFAPLGEDRPRIAQIAELRVRGVPSGSYAVRFPALEVLLARYSLQLVGAGDAALPLPTDAHELLFVPSGSDLLMIQSPNAQTTYRELASAGGLPSELRSALLEPGSAVNVAMRFGNYRLPNQPIDDDAGAPTLESVIGVEAGQAILVARLRNASTDASPRFQLEMRVPGPLLRGYVSALTSTRAE